MLFFSISGMFSNSFVEAYLRLNKFQKQMNNFELNISLFIIEVLRYAFLSIFKMCCHLWISGHSTSRHKTWINKIWNFEFQCLYRNRFWILNIEIPSITHYLVTIIIIIIISTKTVVRWIIIIFVHFEPKNLSSN